MRPSHADKVAAFWLMIIGIALMAVALSNEAKTGREKSNAEVPTQAN